MRRVGERGKAEGGRRDKAEGGKRKEEGGRDESNLFLDDGDAFDVVLQLFQFSFGIRFGDELAAMWV